MKSLILAVFAAAVAVAACGGGEPAPIAQCNGTPTAAVVYVGADAPPALTAVANACVYSTDDEGLGATIARAQSDAQVLRVDVIGNGTAAPLAYMAAHPGHVGIASLWFTPAWSGDLGGSLVSIYANGGACPAPTNHEGPVVCQAAAAFDLSTALAQLQR